MDHKFSKEEVDLTKLEKLEVTEGGKGIPESLEVKGKIEAPQNTPSSQDLDNKKFDSLTKRLDNLNNIENVRKELGLDELKKETTDIIARQKMKIQEEMTGMKQQTTETKQGDLENNVPVPPAEVSNPIKNIESKEAEPFDIKKVYNALGDMLAVFSRRPDIIPNSSLGALSELHDFMTKKIIGEDPNKVGEKVNLDFVNPDEINKEMIEKLKTAMDSLVITDTGG